VLGLVGTENPRELRWYQISVIAPKQRKNVGGIQRKSKAVLNIPSLARTIIYRNFITAIDKTVLRFYIFTGTSLLYMKKQFGQISEIRMGVSFRTRLEPDPEGEISVIQMKDIDDTNLLHSEDLIRIRMPELKKESHIIQREDLLFRSRGLTNTTSLVTIDLQHTVLAAPMMVIRAKKDIVLPTYLHWFLNLPTTQAVLAKQAEGTSVRMISKATLDVLEIPVPSLARQKEIVELINLASEEERLTQELLKQRKRFIEGFLLRRAFENQSRKGH